MVSSSAAITSVEAKTRRIAIYSLKNSLLKIPIQVAGKSLRRVPKPFLVLGLFLTCVGIYLLLQGASSSAPILIPKHFASRKHRQHFRQIQKPLSNEEESERYAGNSNNEAAELDNLDERNHKAIPQKRVVIIKRKKHENIDKQSHRIEEREGRVKLVNISSDFVSFFSHSVCVFVWMINFSFVLGQKPSKVL